MCGMTGGWVASCCAGTGPEGEIALDTLGVRSRSNSPGSSGVCSNTDPGTEFSAYVKERLQGEWNLKIAKLQSQLIEHT